MKKSTKKSAARFVSSMIGIAVLKYLRALGLPWDQVLIVWGGLFCVYSLALYEGSGT